MFREQLDSDDTISDWKEHNGSKWLKKLYY